MNRNIMGIAVLAFTLGIFTNNFAMSSVPANYKVGVVDVHKVVTNSKQVLALQSEQTKKADELKNTIKKAQDEISKETDQKKKEQLIKKFDNDISYIKNTNDKNYAKKLAEIDKSITKTIQEESKKAGYDLVLAKGMVLYGGTDITDTVAKAVK
ncbi:OmpH family outer membrane protein [bacterium]|nr:OmpH family outer membrane protein [bacterium]